MLGIVIGSILLAAGVIGATNAFGVVRHAARLWPRNYTRSDTDLLLDAGFLIRVSSLLLATGGAAMIWLSAA